MRNLFVGCSSAALIACLSACGGAGSGVQSTPAPPPALSSDVTIPKPVTTPTTEDFHTSEYEDFSTSAKNSNVIPAWQAGATGKGIKIGIVDSGITTSNPEFAGRIDPASRDFGGSGSIEDSYGHGTALASIAAAAHDGHLMEGIAYDATLVVMNVAPRLCSSGCSYADSDIAQGIRAAASAGAKVINLSIGGNSPSSSVTDAVRNAAKMGVVFVVAAGNDHSSDPDAFARAVAQAASGQTIIVGALGVDTDPVATLHVDYNQLWANSDMGGSYRDWFIGAPGYALEVAYQQGYDQVSGTSFAAPAVAGAVALLLQAFPNLTPQQIVQILLTTANDLGTTGVDSVFGHGRLDIGRAFQPVGATQLAGSQTAVSLKPSGSAPSATGDAIQRGTLSAVVLDAFRRAFTINLAGTLRPAPSARPLAMALTSNLRTTSTSLGPVTVAMGTTQYANQNTDLTSRRIGPFAKERMLANASVVGTLGHGGSAAFSFSGAPRSLLRMLAGAEPRDFTVNQDVASTLGFDARSTSAVAFRQRIGPIALHAARETGLVPARYAGDTNDLFRLSTIGVEGWVKGVAAQASVGRLDETGTVLGGRLGPLLGPGSATSLFVDGQVGVGLSGPWSIAAYARHGWTRFGAGTFETAGYSIRIGTADVLRQGDRFGLLVSQPLRVSSGGFSVLLPGSFDYGSGSASMEQERMSLSPRGREIATELSYSRPVPAGYAGFNAYVRRQPGHIANAPADVGAVFQLRLNL